jgi:hypothetical protein
LGARTDECPLADFWPRGGHQWDGLARTASGKFIVVEAKAHAAELTSHCMATDHRSLALIETSLEDTKRFYGARKDAIWDKNYYQYANRLAHLYFLRECNKLDAFLVFLNFADASDVGKPCNAVQWEQQSGEIERHLGLSGIAQMNRVGTIIWNVQDMLSGKAKV